MVRKILATLQPLLQEFQDVIPDEIPPGLPPEHFIDFVIRRQAAGILNHSRRRSSLTSMQVKQLLMKVTWYMDSSSKSKLIQKLPTESPTLLLSPSGPVGMI
ncbi:hypothetical protein NC653_038250 [Populus alba x Populus x berolinensis]|uniref:Uncharacterized protein n=2 Tax=Populus TaxID=3689 RepID=A0A4U5Q8Q4_POPAL|nr:hypothetical protein NC653_038250 [Populus alba x Populus x berolinensis]TKS04685.1 hypothetical protein D5086_0000140650 [Populus alba]